MGLAQSARAVYQLGEHMHVATVGSATLAYPCPFLPFIRCIETATMETVVVGPVKMVTAVLIDASEIAIALLLQRDNKV